MTLWLGQSLSQHAMNNYIQSVYTLVAPTPQQIYPVNTDNLNGGRYFNSWLKYGAPVTHAGTQVDDEWHQVLRDHCRPCGWWELRWGGFSEQGPKLVLDSESFSIDNSTSLSLQVCDIVGEAWIWQSDWLTCVRAEALPGRRSDSESRVRGSRASPWCPLVTVHANLSHRPLSLFNTRNLSWEETLGSWLLKW